MCIKSLMGIALKTNECVLEQAGVAVQWSKAVRSVAMQPSDRETLKAKQGLHYLLHDTRTLYSSYGLRS